MGKNLKTKDKEFKEKLRAKNTNKKTQKEWVFTAEYSGGTYMRVGLIHNKSEQNPYDVIVIEILNSRNEVLLWEMRLDEAQGLIFGLSKVLTYIMLDIGSKGKFLQEFCEYNELDKHK